jgi:hypothetical protein
MDKAQDFVLIFTWVKATSDRIDFIGYKEN